MIANNCRSSSSLFVSPIAARIRRPALEAITSAAAAMEPLESRRLMSGGDVVLDWNEILIQSIPNPTPPISWRNMALVHVAMFDAVNAIDRSYEPYVADVKASQGASAEVAVAQAAHDTLAALYPARQAIFDQALAEDLAGVPLGLARQGAAIGKEVARQILELRASDGVSTPVAYTPPNADPGKWQPTPPDFSGAAGANVGLVTPFAIESSAQFRPGPPPALTTPEYAAALNEAKAIGSATNSTRTADQTLVAGLWRVPLTNFAVWNRVAQDVARDQDTNLADSARLFALLNMGINDGLQTSFASKYHYELWRPVTAIQRAAEDGNADTEADPTWTPLHPGTPPYPTYAGNAATVGAVSATVLADVFGTDAVPFTVDFSSYGFPGVTRSYDGFWDAADEEARSRVYGGIHFTFDSVAGQQIGANVGGYILDNYLEPQAGGSDGKGDDAGEGLALAWGGGDLGSNGHRDEDRGERGHWFFSDAADEELLD